MDEMKLPTEDEMIEHRVENASRLIADARSRYMCSNTGLIDGEKLFEAVLDLCSAVRFLQAKVKRATPDAAGG